MAVWHFCSECSTRLYYRFEDAIWNNKDYRFIVSVGLLYNAGVANLNMGNEVAFELKPKYYCFSGDREKLSMGDTSAKYALDSR